MSELPHSVTNEGSPSTSGESLSSEDQEDPKTLFNWLDIYDKEKTPLLAYHSEQDASEQVKKCDEIIDVVIQETMTLKLCNQEETQRRWNNFASDGEQPTIAGAMKKLMGSDANNLFLRIFVILGIPSIADEVHGENAARQWQFVLNLIDTYKKDVLESGMKIDEKSEMQIFLDSEHFPEGDTNLDMIRNQFLSVNAENEQANQVLTLAGIFKDIEENWFEKYMKEAIFITFNPQNPIRQLLCDFSERKPDLCPRALICAPPDVDNLSPEYGKKYYCGDRTSERVRNWLSEDRYQSVDFTNDEVLGKTKLFLAKDHEPRNSTPSPGSSSTHRRGSPKNKKRPAESPPNQPHTTRLRVSSRTPSV